MHTDPIADLLTRIRNASRAGHASVTLPASKVKKAIAEILQEEGFVRSVQMVKDGNFENMVITLSPDHTALMLKRISTPGQRRYLSATEIRSVRNGYGIGIVSTSQGMMTSTAAKEKGIGGEYICEIY